MVFIRILLSWFSLSYSAKVSGFFSRITDPYINFWRKSLNLRVGQIDFSVIVAVVFLSFLLNIFYGIYLSGKITLGYFLEILLLSLWSIISFIFFFCLIVIILRLFAYLTNRNIFSPFWNVIDSIAKPILYRINRILYGKRNVKRLGNYFFAMIISCLIITGFIIGGRFLVMMTASLLKNIKI